jgi:hypothetical protein
MPFSINITERVVLLAPAFSEPQMRQLGAVAIDAEKTRLAAGLNIQDIPAKPLSRGYARQKQRVRGSAFRDLRLTGRTLAGLSVVEASPVSVVVGFSDSEAFRRARFNESIDPMIGLSARDQEVVDVKARDIFASNVRRSNEGKQ